MNTYFIIYESFNPRYIILEFTNSSLCVLLNSLKHSIEQSKSFVNICTDLVDVLIFILYHVHRYVELCMYVHYASTFSDVHNLVSGFSYMHSVCI